MVTFNPLIRGASCKSMRMPPFVIPNEVRNLLLPMSYKTPRVARGDIFGTFARGSEIWNFEIRISNHEANPNMWNKAA